MYQRKVHQHSGLDYSLYTTIMNIPVDEYYNNADFYLETQLKLLIKHHELFKDNYVFTDEIYIWFSCVTELGFFDAPIVYLPHKEPWISGSIIDSHEQLKTMKYPDFYSDGIMPKIHHFYERIQELVKGKLNVMFPEWVRGPFCIASHLRGMENILVDTLIEPEFVKDLMKFITESHIHWTSERQKFLGEGPKKTLKLWNDEIDSAVISEASFEEFILPYEQQLASHYGRVDYWHSCGKTDEFMKYIATYDELQMFHCSPWSDWDLALEIFGKDVAFDVCLNPQEHVYDLPTTDEMAAVLTKIKNQFADRRYAVRADTFMEQQGIENTLNKISSWNTVATKILNGEE